MTVFDLSVTDALLSTTRAVRKRLDLGHVMGALVVLIARIAPGSSGEDAPAAGASYATTPRAIRAIPENRRRFRATVSVASLERENGHFSANRNRLSVGDRCSQITSTKLEIAQRISPPSGGLVLILIRTAQGSRMPPERSTGGAMPSSFVAHRTTCSLSLPTRTYLNVIEGSLPVTSVNRRTNSLHTSLAHRSTGMHKVSGSWGKEDLAHRATDRMLNLTSVRSPRSSSAPPQTKPKV